MKNLASYYNKYKISPVRQNINSLKKFFIKRSLLYKRLGILQNNFNNKKILEIGPGPGLNALYISSLQPKKYVLLDAGEESVQLIKKNFSQFHLKHTKPVIIKKFLEDFESNEKFDIVICEGVLVNNKYAKKNYLKLNSFISDGGLLITTFFPRIGLIPNLIRKLIFLKTRNKFKSFNDKSLFAEKLFKTHLKSLKIKGRTHIDWVQDIIMNEYYLKQNFDPDIINNYYKSKNLFIHSTYPNFYKNWKWYKDISYENLKSFNYQFIKNYKENYHGFLNYKESPNIEIAISEYNKIKKLVDKIFNYSIKYEKNQSIQYLNKIISLLKEFSKIRLFSNHSRESINESVKLLDQNEIIKEDYKRLKKFKSFFGREYCYISFEKRN